VAFSGATGADKEDADLLLHEAAGGEIEKLGLVGGGVEGKVEALEGLIGVEPAAAKPQDKFLLGSPGDLILNEESEELGIGSLSSIAWRFLASIESRIPESLSCLSMGMSSGMGCMVYLLS